MKSVFADALERVKQMTPEEFQRIEREKGLSTKKVKPVYKYELILNESMPSTILHHSILFTKQEILDMLDICASQKEVIIALRSIWDKYMWYREDVITFEAIYDGYLDNHKNKRTNFLKYFPKETIEILKENYGFVTLPEPPADVIIYF